MRRNSLGCITWGDVAAVVSLVQVVGQLHIVGTGAIVIAVNWRAVNLWHNALERYTCTSETVYIFSVFLVLCHIVPYSGAYRFTRSSRLSVCLKMIRRTGHTFRSWEGGERPEELSDKLRSVECQHVRRNTLQHNPAIHGKRHSVWCDRFKRKQGSCLLQIKIHNHQYTLVANIRLWKWSKDVHRDKFQWATRLK